MVTKKQKRERGIAKREAEDKERRAREQHFLALAQAERAAERKKADDASKARAIAKSKKLAKEHEAKKNREKQGIKEYAPVPSLTMSQLRLLGSLLQKPSDGPSYDSGL